MMSLQQYRKGKVIENLQSLLVSITEYIVSDDEDDHDVQLLETYTRKKLKQIQRGKNEKNKTR
jgi:hypothetical protein